VRIEIKCEGFEIDAEPEDIDPGTLRDCAHDLASDIGGRIADLGDSTHGKVTLTFGDVEVTA